MMPDVVNDNDNMLTVNIYNYSVPCFIAVLFCLFGE